MPPRLTITGTVEVLDATGVWFEGSDSGLPAHQPPADGSPCQGEDGFADIGSGASVIVADGAGIPLATPTLGAGATMQQVVGTEIEHTEREALIDAIYGYRVAVANGDPVRVAELNLARANLRVADLQAGGLPSFEGRRFRATWCRVSFTAADLPLADSYQITVTHRGTTTFSRAQVEAAGGTVRLRIG